MGEEANKDSPIKFQLLYSGKEAIKQNLKDPDSFSVIELYSSNNQEIGCLTYKAKNSFNAFIQSKSIIIGSQKTGVIKIVSESKDDFYDVWKLMCVNKELKYEKNQ